MLTDPKLRSQVDALWDKFWTGDASQQEEFTGVVARVESLRGRMGESTRHVDGLFELLLSESFGGNL